MALIRTSCENELLTARKKKKPEVSSSFPIRLVDIFTYRNLGRKGVDQWEGSVAPNYLFSLIQNDGNLLILLTTTIVQSRTHFSRHHWCMLLSLRPPSCKCFRCWEKNKPKVTRFGSIKISCLTIAPTVLFLFLQSHSFSIFEFKRSLAVDNKEKWRGGRHRPSHYMSWFGSGYRIEENGTR